MSIANGHTTHEATLSEAHAHFAMRFHQGKVCAEDHAHVLYGPQLSVCIWCSTPLE